MKEGEYSFYQWSAADVAKHFGVDEKVGLSEKRAILGNKKFGPNALSKIGQKTSLKIFLRQFANFFVILLFCAAAISYFVDGFREAIVILLIALINIFSGFFQENKSKKAIFGLNQALKTKCKVLRDGKIKKISSCDLTLGDIVLVETGDKVPADIRLFEAESLQVDESNLAGKSKSIDKNIKIYPIETALADRKNMIYDSTFVVAGRGKGIVCTIGDKTEFGKIAQSIEKSDRETELENQINYLSKKITVVSVFIAVLIFALGFWRGNEVLPLLTFAIAIFIAAVPESLPSAITLALSVGASRLAEKKAIIRKLSVIETLGAASIIISDKIGGELSVDLLSLFEKSGFQRLNLANEIINQKAADLLVLAAACSNLGDPVEAAMAESLRWHIGNQSELVKLKYYKRLSEIPLSSDKKFMAVLASAGGQKELIAKGMPEKIIELCNLTKSQKLQIKKEAASLSRDDYKIIALASKKVNSTGINTLSGLDFLGLFAVAENLPADIKAATAQMAGANLRPVVLAGLSPKDEFDAIKSYEKNGDCAVSVATKNSTDLARDCADLILQDDNYSTIVSAIEFGRATCDNIKNIVVHLLAGNFSEVFLVALAFLFGLPLPITALQILWINLITDSFPALALSFENPSKILSQNSRPAKKSFNSSIKYSAKLSAVSLILCLVVYLWGLHFSVEKARTLTFTFLVLVELAFVVSVRSKKRIWQSLKSFFGNIYLWAAVGFSVLMQAVLFFEPIRKTFGITKLNFSEIIFLLSMALAAFFAAEIIRFFGDRKELK